MQLCKEREKTGIIYETRIIPFPIGISARQRRRAIGIGNVWRFPYVTGENGGGFFVLIYLICLLVMGVPVLTMELAVGRAGKKSAVLAYKNLEKPGQKWHIHGWF